MEEKHIACRGNVDACLVCSFEDVIFHVSLCFFKHYVIAVQCSEYQSGEKTGAG